MNTAQKIIKPSTPKQFRVVFLYTGQGDSAILAVPTGDGVDDYMYVLIDCDVDKEDTEVNIPDLLKDLLGNSKLPLFINTHPHKDHVGGIKQIYEEIGIEELWHSNHNAKGKNKDSDDELKYVLKKVGTDKTFLLKGSNSLNKIRKHDDTETFRKLGLIDYQIFAPAEYVCDDIEDEDDDTRYNRIHEQCGVFKFIYKDKSILFTGDADKKAWKDHITDYHKSNLKADIMTASHHGSNTVFKSNSDDKDPFKKHLDYIDPKYLVISAPKQKDSPHGHPNDDALEIYREKIKTDFFHLGQENDGSDPYCLVVTVKENGELLSYVDKDLIRTYSKKREDALEEQSNYRASVSLASSAKPHAKL